MGELSFPCAREEQEERHEAHGWSSKVAILLGHIHLVDVQSKYPFRFLDEP